jgi:hypothetical protein
MAKKNQKNLSLWKKFLKKFKKLINVIKKNNQAFTAKYPNILASIQLTVVYFIAFISLFYSLINVLGDIPDTIYALIPSFYLKILYSPLLRFILSPEKTYVVYLLAIEFIIFRTVFRFSQLFKYNLLLIFLLEMFQNLLLSYWDLIFQRTAEIGEVSTIDINFAIFSVSLIFCLLFVLYFYGYICALRGKFVTYPYMYWLTDSIAFWLQIKTRNMGAGDKRK